jgi:hypothetical protein
MAVTLGRPAADPADLRRPTAQGIDTAPTTTAWLPFGLSLLAFVMLTLTQAAVIAGPEPLEGPGFLRSAVLVSGVAAIATWIVAWLREPPSSLAEIPRQALRPWNDPRRSWPAAALGALLSLPLLGLFVPTGLGDADSVRAVAAVKYVHRHGIGLLVDTQDNFGPHLVLGPAVALGGLAGVRLVTVLAVPALAAAAAYTTRRISGSMLGAAAAALALLSTPAVLARATLVPMYPAMLACGTLGCWLAYRAMTDHRSWRYALGAGASLVAALELHNVGQLFLAVPGLLVIACPRWRPALAGLLRIGVVIAGLAVPRLVVNVSEGGLSRVTENRTDYWITKGYVSRIQTELLGYEGVGEPIGSYLERLPGRFVGSLGAEGWLALGLAALAILGLRWRAKLFVLACLGFMVAAITVKQIPPFPRYYSPLWPGIAILAGLAVGWLVRRRQIAGRVVGTILVLALALLSALSYRTVAQRTAEQAAAVEAKPYQQLADMVDDGKGVIGARSHVLAQVDPDIPTYGGQFLTEREYVTYLSWPSDDAVIAMMERHDIGWVLINPDPRLETQYHNTWLVPAHGLVSRQVAAVAASPAFCQVAAIDGFVLYRLGPCAVPT